MFPDGLLLVFLTYKILQNSFDLRKYLNRILIKSTVFLKSAKAAFIFLNIFSILAFINKMVLSIDAILIMKMIILSDGTKLISNSYGLV